MDGNDPETDGKTVEIDGNDPETDGKTVEIDGNDREIDGKSLTWTSQNQKGSLPQRHQATKVYYVFL